MRSYFDGANKADSLQYDFLTLASVTGSIDQWRPFKKEWSRILREHGADYVHTTDLVSLSDPFDRDHGWDEKRRDALLLDCVRAAGRHFARPRTEEEAGRHGLYPHTITVNLKDFVWARETIPGNPNTAGEVCAMQALIAYIEWGKITMMDENYLFVFDQGEEFFGHIDDLINNKKSKKEFPILQNIALSKANMRLHAPLQLADLLAWCVSHQRQTGIYSWHDRMLRIPRAVEFADKSHFSKPIERAVELRREWKLPPRKKHR